MKILANDGLMQEGINLFEKSDMQIDIEKKDLANSPELIQDYDALIVRSGTKVTEDILKAGQEKLKIVGRAGVGYDNVDLTAANKYGIVVKNAPNGNTNAVAELGIGLMIALSRNMNKANYTLHNGIWQKKPFKGIELRGKKLGIIGCGRIGQRLADLASVFPMKILGYDQYPQENPRIEYVALDYLLQNSDFISLHTGGKDVIIGQDELEQMKNTSYVINLSRGSNIDENALYDALKNKKIAGAGLDCHMKESKEDKPFESKLKGLENVILTSHIGAATHEAQNNTSTEIAKTVIEYLKKGNWKNAVNVHSEICGENVPTHQLYITHADTPGIFGKMDSILGQYGINIRDHPSRKMDPNVQTVYNLHQEPTNEVKDALRNIEGVLIVKN